ncbi:MAG: hypothetical protein Q9188_002409 [Gyalolechia gomerana]
MAEIAGLVLVTFPVIVHGLNGYAQGLDTWKSWRNYRRELKGYARTLDCQRVWCLDTLEELFEGIATTDHEIAELMEDPSGPHWNRYETELQERLGTAYPIFLETMREMTDALEALRRKIGIEDQGNVDWSNYSSIEREMKKLRLVLSKKIYTELIAQIDKANKDLREFTHQNRFLEPVRRKRRSKRNAEFFKELRRSARSLYNVLIEGAAWSCRCKSQHIASLRLETRHRGLPETKFRVLLANGAPQSSDQHAWTWREIDIAPKSDPTTADTSPVRKSSRLRKSVRWDTPSTPSVSEPSTWEVTDLCNAIQHPTADGVVGMVVDNMFNHKHHIKQCILPQCEVDSKSLANLLRTSNDQPTNLHLNRRDRLRMAVTLASSVLQLDKTFWLRPRWSSADIFFLYQDSKTRFDQPYLSSRICVNNLDSHNQQPNVADEMAYLIHSDILFALGITLIELAFGKALVDMQRPEDTQSDEVLTIIKTSYRILDSVYTESGGRYGDVVRRCLHCSFDVKDKSFENNDFLEAVFDLVVTPLIQDLEAFDGCVI